MSFLILKETICVGAARFELATSWSQTRRDDRTTLRPELLLIKNFQADANVLLFFVQQIKTFISFCLCNSFASKKLIFRIRIQARLFFCSVKSKSLRMLFQLTAVREGFEPSVQLPVRQFSKLVLSASQAPHPTLIFQGMQM